MRLEETQARLDRAEQRAIVAEQRASEAEQREQQALARVEQEWIDKHTDPGTGIPNRKFFNGYVEKIHEAAITDDFTYSVIMVDIDSFKAVNDTYGHLAGDRVLENVATILCKGHRSEDIIAHLRAGIDESQHSAARYGGEEFALILPLCGLENAQKIAEEMRRAVEGYTHLLPNDVTLKETASFGVATFDPVIDYSSDTVISRADQALYRAKKEHGKNIVVASTELEEFKPVDRNLNLGRQEPSGAAPKIEGARADKLPLVKAVV